MADYEIRSHMVKRLVDDWKAGFGLPWGTMMAQLAERADYHCEYCDLSFYDSLEHYKLMQVDHIVPIARGGPVDGSDDLSNLALACKPCNVDFKGTYDPREHAVANATREQLIETAWLHRIKPARENFANKLARERATVARA